MRCDTSGKRRVGQSVVAMEVGYVGEAGKKDKTVKTRPLLPMARLKLLTLFRSEAPFRGDRQGSREVTNYIRRAAPFLEWPATTVQRGAPLDGASEAPTPFPERLLGRGRSEGVPGTQLRDKSQQRKGLMLRERTAPRPRPAEPERRAKD